MHVPVHLGVRFFTGSNFKRDNLAADANDLTVGRELAASLPGDLCGNTVGSHRQEQGSQHVHPHGA